MPVGHVSWEVVHTDPDTGQRFVWTGAATDPQDALLQAREALPYIAYIRDLDYDPHWQVKSVRPLPAQYPHGSRKAVP